MKRRPSLDDPSGLLDWSAVDAALAGISCAAKGEPGWPPLALVKALLLAVWYDLSDVTLAEALDDRASFRRFCGFARHEATPGRTTFVRFRDTLVECGLDRCLFGMITAQLKARAVTVKDGMLVDATVTASARKGDGEARWVKHRSKSSVHGYKAHVDADADTALVEEVAVTPANVHDGKAGDTAVPAGPGQVSADSAYRGEAFAAAVRAKGGTPRIATTHLRRRDETETLARLEAWNASIHRGCVEKVFGTWKRSDGLRRMQWVGLAKATLQVHLTAIAYNIRTTFGIVAAA